MTKIALHRLSFGSYVKLFFLSGIGLGAVFGILILIIGLVGGQVDVHIGNNNFSGIEGGVLGFIASPIAFGCVFAWFSVLMYLPFKLILKIFKGIKLTILLEDTYE